MPTSFDMATSTNTGDNVQLNFVKHDLELKQRTLAELERVNLRRAVVEERRRFAELITCLKPVLDSHVALFSDSDSIEECVSAIENHNFDPNELPLDTERAIEEAVEHVSSRIDLGDRKLSHVRSAMRFGKPPSGLEFQRANLLSGHSSQLSLQSTFSTQSTTPSWSAIAHAAAANSLIVNRTASPHNGSIDMSDQTKFFPQSPSSTCNPFSSARPAGAGDSVSLFDHAELNQEEPASPKPNGFDDHPSDPESTFVPLNDSPHHTKFIRPTRPNDDDEADGEGATTEDTEGGETEDEERVAAAQAAETEGKAKPILYPNQAIPAPVYTNLSELKRAAARKFGETDPTSSNTVHAEHVENGQPATRTLPNDCPDSTTSVMTSQPSSAVAATSSAADSLSTAADLVHIDGFINTPIVSGTSTFKRRQSEYGRRNAAPSVLNGHPNGNNTNPLAFNPSFYRPLAYNSITPSLVRRGSQVCIDGSDGTSRSRARPTNPPRRSSSVSRELTRHRTPQTNAAIDPYAPSCHYFSPNSLSNNGLIDPGIQRVSSSIFTHSNSGSNSQQPRIGPAHNNSDHHPHLRANLVQVPPAQSSQYASVSVNQCSTNEKHYATTNGLFSRPNPTISGLCPPPLATVPAPNQSRNNQLMFGVKVLPNQAPPMGLAACSQYSRLPHHYRTLARQASCEPEGLVPADREAPLTDSPGPIRADMPPRFVPCVGPAKPSGRTATQSKGDAVTSFIE